MCGIVGYVGSQNIGTEFVLNGLQALEYRGYDSAGIATLTGNKPSIIKQVGRVEALNYQVKEHGGLGATLAIGHTRWATHGSPTVQNAHPHFNAKKTIYVVHNGIIENYQELKRHLQSKGYTFNSQTDTEVIPHLIDHYMVKGKTFIKAFEWAIKDLQGAYAIVALTTNEPDKLFVARLSSPIVIGVGKDEHFLASDATAIMDRTKQVMYLDDYEIAEITKDAVHIHNFRKEAEVQRESEELDYDTEKATLGDYPHYMLKEINEAPQTIQSAIRGRLKPERNTVKLGGLESIIEQLRYIDRIVIVACGTSYYAGLVGEYLIEEVAGIPVEVQLASEFKYRNEPFSRSTALLAISQSGETADTIAALKKVEGYGVLKLGVVNTVGSTIARITDAGVYCHAGPEQSVASTKAFIAQVTVLADIALHLSDGKTKLYTPLLKELAALPEKAKQVLKQADIIKQYAKKYSDYRDFLFIGRNYLYPCALEGALKLKEVSYIHAEGYAAGEMKHGPLAMIDKDFPTFALACDSPLLDKTLSNIEEIKARSGPVLAVATAGNEQIPRLTDDVIYIPSTLEQLQPLLVAIVIQLFAYYVALERGLNVDRPRNLAKSVTVE
jgi:glutamine---fructose-6-phosphate transaminase (isomerizing)